MHPTPITELFLHDALRVNARNRPALPAVMEARQSWTWITLWDSVCAIHLALAQRGVVRGSRVAAIGLLPEQEIRLGFALSCAGAILVPIAAGKATEENQHILSDVQPQFLVLPGPSAWDESAGVPSAVPAICFDKLDTARPGARAASESATAATRRSWRDAVTIAYADDAGPEPAGIVATHRQTILGGFSAAGAVGLQRDDCIWLDRPLAGTAFWAWVSIATFQQASLIVGDMAEQLPGDREVQDACTVVVTDPGRDPASLTRLERLRLVVFDRMATTVALQAHAAAWNRVGRPAPRFAATLSHPEAGPFALIARPEDIAAEPGCLGTPLPGSYARIARADGSVPSAGEVGELQLRSPFVMDSYYRQPERTADAFRDGWLCTGIATRRSRDGCYHAAEETESAFQSNAKLVTA